MSVPAGTRLQVTLSLAYGLGVLAGGVILLSSLVVPRPAQAQAGPHDPCVRAGDGGDLARALRCFETRLKRDPEDVHARNAIGAIHFTERRFDQARVVFDEVLRIEPRNGVALNGAAMSLIALGRHGEGFAALERAIRTDPRNIQAVNNLALLAFITGQTAIAEQSWTHALSVEEDNVDARVGMAEVRIAQRNFPEAVDHLEIAVRTEPDSARAHWLLGKIAAQTDPEKALPLLERAAFLAPNDADVLYDWGLVLFERGEVRKAGAAFGEALRLAPEEPRLYLHLGLCYLEISAPSEALAAFEEALRSSPGAALASRIHVHRGIALERLERERDAEHAYRVALKLDPGNAWASVNLGVVLFGRTQFDDAARAFEAAVRSASLPEADLGLWLSRRQQRTEEARAAYARMMKLPEGHPVRRQAEEMSGRPVTTAAPTRVTPIPARPSPQAPRSAWP